MFISSLVVLFHTLLIFRFGKFAIETRVDRAIDNRSLVSDSWSTDVYASDSEPPENQYEAAEPPLIPVSGNCLMIYSA